MQQVACQVARGAGGKGRHMQNQVLTPSQVAIAKRLGVPLEERAKHVEGV